MALRKEHSGRGGQQLAGAIIRPLRLLPENRGQRALSLWHAESKSCVCATIDRTQQLGGWRRAWRATVCQALWHGMGWRAACPKELPTLCGQQTGGGGEGSLAVLGNEAGEEIQCLGADATQQERRWTGRKELAAFWDFRREMSCPKGNVLQGL